MPKLTLLREQDRSRNSQMSRTTDMDTSTAAAPAPAAPGSQPAEITLDRKFTSKVDECIPVAHFGGAEVKEGSDDRTSFILPLAQLMMNCRLNHGSSTSAVEEEIMTSFVRRVIRVADVNQSCPEQKIQQSRIR